MVESKRSKITDEHKQEAARLKALWDDGRPHRTQAIFGEHYGLGNQANVGHYLNGRSPLNPKAATAFAAELGCNVGEFSPRVADELSRLTGTIETSTTRPAAAPYAPATDEQGQSGDIVIVQFEAGGGMDTTGHLLLEDQPGVIKKWHVNEEWFRRNITSYTSVANLCIVTGFGPSMRPMFNPGDPLLVDRGVRSINHEGVYFFRIGDEGFIKLVQRIPEFDGSGFVLRIISKNPDYPPYDISPKNPHLEILGKVLTVWRSEQF